MRPHDPGAPNSRLRAKIPQAARGPSLAKLEQAGAYRPLGRERRGVRLRVETVHCGRYHRLLQSWVERNLLRLHPGVVGLDSSNERGPILVLQEGVARSTTLEHKQL